MIGNAFRVVIDREHTNHFTIQGRFDLHGPLIQQLDSLLAIIDFNANYKGYGYPRLDSAEGVLGKDFWEIDMPANSDYEIIALALKKVSGNEHKPIEKVQFEVLKQDGVWQTHNDGQWYPTGMLSSDDQSLERRVLIDPPMIGNQFRIILDEENANRLHLICY